MKLDPKRTEELIRSTGRDLKTFCDDTGIKLYNLSKYLHGKNVPMKTVYRIADELGVSTFEIMKVGNFDY